MKATTIIGSTILSSIEGKPLLDENQQPLTLKTVVCNALMTTYQGERIAGKEKYRRFKLAQRVMNTQGATELSKDEATLVTELIGQLYGPVVVGPIYDLFGGSGALTAVDTPAKPA